MQTFMLRLVRDFTPVIRGNPVLDPEPVCLSNPVPFKTALTHNTHALIRGASNVGRLQIQETSFRCSLSSVIEPQRVCRAGR